MRTAAIIVAAGRGTRMGGGARGKIALPIAGVPMLARAVGAFLSHPRIDTVIVVGNEPVVRAVLGPTATDVVIVAGGERRQDSVRAGLGRIGGADMVLVHDAARPLVRAGVIERVLDEAARSGAAVPAIPIDDTIKRVGRDGAILETVPRENLVRAQTPQGFRAEVLRTAFASADADRFTGTDEASLVERAGGRVSVVPGSRSNIKITRPADLRLAEAIAGACDPETDDA